MHHRIFGEVSYHVSVVLTRMVHGLAKIYPITWLVASLNAQLVGSVISLHYLGCPDFNTPGVSHELSGKIGLKLCQVVIISRGS